MLVCLCVSEEEKWRHENAKFKMENRKCKIQIVKCKIFGIWKISEAQICVCRALRVAGWYNV